MNARKHAELLAYSFLTWLTFYIIGLPEYYQQWYPWAKVAVVILVTAAYVPVTRYTLESYWSDGNHLKNSLWLALYLTLPLFVYDYLLLAWYMGLGIGFVVPYWYLTFFYFSFWIQFPAVGYWMEKRDITCQQEQVETSNEFSRSGVGQPQTVAALPPEGATERSPDEDSHES